MPLLSAWQVSITSPGESVGTRALHWSMAAFSDRRSAFVQWLQHATTMRCLPTYTLAAFRDQLMAVPLGNRLSKLIATYTR
jgi:hypothetical protein